MTFVRISEDNRPQSPAEADTGTMVSDPSPPSRPPTALMTHVADALEPSHHGLRTAIAPKSAAPSRLTGPVTTAEGGTITEQLFQL
jgi:hypothetical protein